MVQNKHYMAVARKTIDDPTVFYAVVDEKQTVVATTSDRGYALMIEEGLNLLMEKRREVIEQNRS